MEKNKNVKIFLGIFKKMFLNIITFKNTKIIEKVIVIVYSIITLIIALIYFHISFFFLVNYFLLKACLGQMKEEYISIRYKGFSAIFNDRVKVVNVIEGRYILSSFVTINTILKKKDEIEHYLNRRIVDINQNGKNFRNISIDTTSLKEKRRNLLSKTYLLEKIITTIKRGKEEIFFSPGVDENGNILTFDLIKLTHTFISGTQGAGKSNLLNVIIQTLMYFNTNIFYIMCDFKGGVELNQYNIFENTTVLTKLEELNEKLNDLVIEMDDRYKKILDAGVKKISQYNIKNKNNEMAYIILVIDEMSCIRLNSKNEIVDEIESKLLDILNRGRAAGIIGLCATQRPGSNQINTDIRDRFDTKISGRIKDKRTQTMAGVGGTENLNQGECIIQVIEKTIKFKSFFIDEIKNNKVYENLTKALKEVSKNEEYIKPK